MVDNSVQHPLPGGSSIQIHGIKTCRCTYIQAISLQPSEFHIGNDLGDSYFSYQRAVRRIAVDTVPGRRPDVPTSINTEPIKNPGAAGSEGCVGPVQTYAVPRNWVGPDIWRAFHPDMGDTCICDIESCFIWRKCQPVGAHHVPDDGL